MGGLPTDSELDALRLVPAPIVDRQAARRRIRALPWPLRSARLRLVAADLLIVVGALVVASRLAPAGLDRTSAAALALLWCAALAGAGAWDHPVRATRPRSALRATCVVGLGCWAGDALVDPRASSAQLLALTAGVGVALLSTRVLVLVSDRTRPPPRTVLVGDGDEVRRVLGELDRGHRAPLQVTTVCVGVDDAEGLTAAAEHGVPVGGGIEDLVAAAVVTGATAVLITPGRRVCPATARRLSWRAHAAGLEVFLGTGLLDVAPARATLVAGGDVGLVHLRPTTIPSGARLLKGIVERLLAAVAVLAFLPLLVAITVAVRVDSPGPSLFRQTRVGRDGRTFTMYKFRTMTVDAERVRDTLADDNDGDGVLFKIRSDPRITRVGGLLRRYSLDELPQLVNIVLGHMSLVGPRPALPREVAQYDVDPRHRLVVKPGLTGLWQVSGRSDLSWEESVRLDLHYVDNWSLALDLSIVVRTLRAVVSHRGAY